MTITREDFITIIAKKANFCQNDVRALLQVFGDTILDVFDNVTEDEDITIHLFEGLKINGSILPERERRSPITGEKIIAKPTMHLKCMITSGIKQKAQKRYQERCGSGE